MLREQMRSYSRHDPKSYHGDPRRGAALGRPQLVGDKNYSGVVRLARVRLDADGYDGLGTYWGIGAPLWWAASEDGTIDRTMRASTRATATQLVLAEYPNAKVRR